MYDSKEELLELLEFGSVDSESEENLDKLMSGLELKGDDMIRALYETGMLEAQHGRGSADSSFEIPKLFRAGLGLVLRGRP